MNGRAKRLVPVAGGSIMLLLTGGRVGSSGIGGIVSKPAPRGQSINIQRVAP